MNIRNRETERLLQVLVELMGESKTEAVTQALRARIERIRREQGGRRLADELDLIARECASLRVRDSRLADEILGYDENGLPTR